MWLLGLRSRLSYSSSAASSKSPPQSTLRHWEYSFSQYLRPCFPARLRSLVPIRDARWSATRCTVPLPLSSISSAMSTCSNGAGDAPIRRTWGQSREVQGLGHRGTLAPISYMQPSHLDGAAKLLFLFTEIGFVQAAPRPHEFPAAHCVPADLQSRSPIVNCSLFRPAGTEGHQWPQRDFTRPYPRPPCSGTETPSSSSDLRHSQDVFVSEAAATTDLSAYASR